jgi:hypothetical protein
MKVIRSETALEPNQVSIRLLDTSAIETPWPLSCGSGDSDLGTDLLQGALAAPWLARHADPAAVLDQAVAQVNPFGAGDHRHQVELDRHGHLVGGQSQPASQPLDVGVNHDTRGDPECGSQYHVGRLAADTGQLRQGFQVARNLAVELLDQVAGHRLDVPGLGAEETRRSNQLRELTQIADRHAPRVGEPLKQGGRDQVDPDVGTLGRKDRRDQKLKRVLVNQSTACLRIETFQFANDLPGLSLRIGARSLHSRHRNSWHLTFKKLENRL